MEIDSELIELTFVASTQTEIYSKLIKKTLLRLHKRNKVFNLSNKYLFFSECFLLSDPAS